jgi:Cu2+-exporting ATPase
MSCCVPDAEAVAEARRRSPSSEELRLVSRPLGDGALQTDLSVPAIHCAACIGTIERGLARLPGVEHVRVNLSAKRASVRWRGEAGPPLVETLAALGYDAHLFEPEDASSDLELARLIRALAVAGFCAMNIMLLSVSVWSGADAETRHIFHWLSAFLAVPALFYSGQVFFHSAWSALRHGRTNMDVPISIGVSLAFGLSLYDTIHNGPHAYFDAATTLLFFLLGGRTLDHVMREKARTAVRGLARLSPPGATVMQPDATRRYLPVGEIEPGMQVLLAAGDRVPVDGRVMDGVSEIDCSIITGESALQRAEAGVELRAGTLNLGGPLTVLATARADSSFLAEMVRLMEAAEGGKARYRRVADRAAQLYSPVVHVTAFLTFLGWMFAVGDWHLAISIAVGVLIITCPCALGLAVPMVQVVAARRLFENGIMVKDGSAMERLAEIDTVVFDKTGTLTLGRPRLVNAGEIGVRESSVAAALAAHSNHPVSRALAQLSDDLCLELSGLKEEPGYGVEAVVNGRTWRLGRADWVLAVGEARPARGATVLSEDGKLAAEFVFEDKLRPGAAAAIAVLKVAGMQVEILSGDGADTVAAVAADLGIGGYESRVLPQEKTERLAALAAQGRKVLMVGDGLNDAPALAAAHASMAPATAADVGRNAADFVFLHDGLEAVPLALTVSRDAGRLIRQNFALAILYNAIALPLAISGLVTPLIAALAMSVSSIFVIANSLRLNARTEGSSKNEEGRLKFAPPIPHLAGAARR